MMAEEYVYQCARTPTCDEVADTHGVECERINDLARGDFYFNLMAEAFADKIDALVQAVIDEESAR